MKPKQLWVTEGDEINFEKVEELIYRNTSVNDFLESDNKKFIIASKGVGKTLLLRLKRRNLENRYGASALFIPSNAPYLDFAQEQLSMLGKNQMAILTDVQKAKIFWQYALILSILSYGSKNKDDIDFGRCATIPEWVIELVNSKQYHNPCDVFTELVTKSNVSKVLDEINSSFLEINRVFINSINYGVHIFIDRLDQALKDTPRNFWIAIQTGLLEGAWDLSRKNTHIKVYCSIRQEAYYNYSSEDRNAISGSVVFIKYTTDDLVKMLNKSSKFYEGGKDFSTLMRQSKFQNPKTGIYENLDKYIIRHTMYRPRDFVSIVGKLDRKNKFVTKEFRENVNKVACEEIAKNLFYENRIFLNCLKDKEDREDFLSLIPHNVIDRNLLLKVCCQFNKQHGCAKKGCHFTDECKHPFSELYNLGLLGVIDKDDVGKKNSRKQKFKKVEDIQTFNQNLLPENVSYYLIHPCLNDYIKALRTRRATDGLAYIIPFITISADGDWGSNEESMFTLFATLEAKHPRELRDKIYNDLKPLSIRKRIDRVKEYIAEYVAQSTTKKQETPKVIKEPSKKGEEENKHSRKLVDAFDSLSTTKKHNK